MPPMADTSLPPPQLYPTLCRRSPEQTAVLRICTRALFWEGCISVSLREKPNSMWQLRRPCCDSDDNTAHLKVPDLKLEAPGAAGIRHLLGQASPSGPLNKPTPCASPRPTPLPPVRGALPRGTIAVALVIACIPQPHSRLVGRGPWFPQTVRNALKTIPPHPHQPLDGNEKHKGLPSISPSPGPVHLHRI